MKFKQLIEDIKKRSLSEINYATSGINPGDIVDYQGTRAAVKMVSTGGEVVIKLPFAGKEITVDSAMLKKIKPTKASKKGEEKFYKRFIR